MKIVTPNPLPTAYVGTPYSCALQASGGVPPYVWSCASGSLPSGLVLSSSGLISGTATATALQTVQLAVSDSSSPPQRLTAYRDAIVETAGSAPVQIATSQLPSGTAGRAYTAQLRAIGGSPPYGWSATNLPPGLILSNAGVLSGSASGAGSFQPTFMVADSAKARASLQLPIVISAATPVISAAYATGYTRLYDDRDSGAELDVTAFLPNPAPGYGWLGHSLMQGYAAYFGGAPALTVRAIDPSATAPPIGFREIWDDHGSGGTWSYTFWELIPPPGYRALGQLFRLRRAPGDYNPPSPAETAGLLCVREDLVVPGAYGGLLWINTGCEADNSASIFGIVSPGTAAYETGGSAAIFYAGRDTALATPPAGPAPIGVLSRSSAVTFDPDP